MAASMGFVFFLTAKNAIVRQLAKDIFYKGKCVNTESGCGSKPVLPATPVNCKYDGPYCVGGSWQYKLICADTSTSAVNAGAVSGVSSGGAVPAVKAVPVQIDSTRIGN